MVKKSILAYIVTLIIVSIAVYFVLKWRKNKPIIHHFRASTFWKAFVLNSIAASLVIFIALTTKKNFDTFHVGNDDEYIIDPKKIVQRTNFASIFLTLASTFVTSMAAYTIMYVLFGFGGGLLAN